jgi:hypothetical protein
MADAKETQSITVAMELYGALRLNNYRLRILEFVYMGIAESACKSRAPQNP